MASVNKWPSWDLNPRLLMGVHDLNREAMLRGKPRSISTAPKAMSAVVSLVSSEFYHFFAPPTSQHFFPNVH